MSSFPREIPHFVRNDMKRAISCVVSEFSAEEWCFNQGILFPFPYGVLKAFSGACPADFALPVAGNETTLRGSLALLMPDTSAHDLLAGLLGGSPLPHQLHDQKTPADLQDIFAHACCGGSACLVVRIQTATDER